MKVDSLPLSINGENLYQFPYQKDKRLKAVAYWRPWDRDMSVKWKGAENDSVRAQHCKGSYKCKNPKCSFKQQHGKANKIQFEKNRDGDVVYKGCGRCSIFVPCVARSTWSSCPTFQRFVFTTSIYAYLPNEKKSSPTLRCRTISSKEPKFKTI